MSSLDPGVGESVSKHLERDPKRNRILEFLLSTLRVCGTVAAILLIVAYFAMCKPSDFARSDSKSIAETFVNEVLETPLLSYRQNTGSFPPTWPGLLSLVRRPDGVTDWNGPYLITREIPLDPWGAAYHYRFPGIHNPTGYDCWSSGPDKIDGTADDIGNW